MCEAIAIEQQTYLLPPTVVAALTTNRPELINVHINHMKAGGASQDHIEMSRLIRDLIYDRIERERKIASLSLKLENIDRALGGARNSIAIALEEVNAE